MLVSAIYKPEDAAQLKIVSGTKNRNRADRKKVVPVFTDFLSKNANNEAPPAKLQNELLSSKIFNITFSYLQHLVKMKVLKVSYNSGESIYKIVLNSSLSKDARMCWLQYRLPDWVILLGPELDEKLQRDITSAIECQEF